jgi:low temperature requirement protein LtrA
MTGQPNHPRHQLFRHRAEGVDHSPVTYIELFFDLVFVFAITQLSHGLMHHLSGMGALETLILFLAVWWVWIFTGWTTNWLDPERGHVRLMLIMLMIGGLALAAAIPKAFGDNGLLFAGAYVAMQMGRTLYMVWAASGVNEARQRNFLRIAFWFGLTAPLWIGGAMLSNEARLICWGLALLIEYAAPSQFFPTPGLGRSSGSDWDISGGHMAERCALFIIIALGEAIIVTGAAYADLPQDVPTTLAFLASFIGSAALWWIYFDVGAKRGSEMMARTNQAGRLARDGYTYGHMPIVAGVIVTAVGDGLALDHPGQLASVGVILTLCGGPALFLLGNQWFKWMSSDQKYPPLSHFIGNLLLTIVGMAGWSIGVTTLAMAWATTLVLVMTAAWEWFSLHGGWRRWARWLGRLFGANPASPV